MTAKPVGITRRHTLAAAGAGVAAVEQHRGEPPDLGGARVGAHHRNAGLLELPEHLPQGPVGRSAPAGTASTRGECATMRARRVASSGSRTSTATVATAAGSGCSRRLARAIAAFIREAIPDAGQNEIDIVACLSALLRVAGGGHHGLGRGPLFGLIDIHLKASIAAVAAAPAAVRVEVTPKASVEAAAVPLDLSKHPGVVISPMVGTAYGAPEPGAKPFIDIGSKVKAGDTLLISCSTSSLTLPLTLMRGETRRMIPVLR